MSFFLPTSRNIHKNPSRLSQKKAWSSQTDPLGQKKKAMERESEPQTAERKPEIIKRPTKAPHGSQSRAADHQTASSKQLRAPILGAFWLYLWLHSMIHCFIARSPLSKFQNRFEKHGFTTLATKSDREPMESSWVPMAPIFSQRSGGQFGLIPQRSTRPPSFVTSQTPRAATDLSFGASCSNFRVVSREARKTNIIV